MIPEKELCMAKVTAISFQKNSTQLTPTNFTQVGGIYGAEIRPEQYLIDAGVTQHAHELDVEEVNEERDPRFFRVE